jgi:type IV pilus assembly protein PilV
MNKKQQGATLLEVLITVVILSVGVLGAVKMQILSLQGVNSSYNHGLAAHLANDMADRMRINSVSVLANSYNHTAAPAAYPDCAANACTNAQLASFDIGDWQAEIANKMPGITGEVERAAGNNFIVTIRWDDDRSGGAGTDCTVAAADLNCFQLPVSLR